MENWDTKPEGMKRPVPWNEPNISPKVRRNLEGSFTEAKER